MHFFWAKSPSLSATSSMMSLRRRTCPGAITPASRAAIVRTWKRQFPSRGVSKTTMPAAVQKRNHDFNSRRRTPSFPGNSAARLLRELRQRLVSQPASNASSTAQARAPKTYIYTHTHTYICISTHTYMLSPPPPARDLPSRCHQYHLRAHTNQLCVTMCHIPSATQTSQCHRCTTSPKQMPPANEILLNFNLKFLCEPIWKGMRIQIANGKTDEAPSPLNHACIIKPLQSYLERKVFATPHSRQTSSLVVLLIFCSFSS